MVTQNSQKSIDPDPTQYERDLAIVIHGAASVFILADRRPPSLKAILTAMKIVEDSLIESVENQKVGL